MSTEPPVLDTDGLRRTQWGGAHATGARPRETTFAFTCPHCARALHIPLRYDGHPGYCTHCRGYVVPRARVAPSPYTPPAGGKGGDWASKQVSRFVDPSAPLPPELLQEQMAIALRPGAMVADRFQVVDQVGLGGMGAVYHVRDARLNHQDKALKVIRPSLLSDPVAHGRFLKEIELCQKLSHESIVRVHDLGEDRKRGIQFFTMEYIRGVTLDKLQQARGGKISAEEAVGITRQVCEALQYAHRYTVHRDLKAQNIMVVEDGSVRVLDFGLAKFMSSDQLTKSNMALGTAYYQAPEQGLEHGPVDQRADIYSLGIILYEMLTGLIPLGAFEVPGRLVGGVPGWLDDVVLRCLEHHAGDRFQTAEEFKEALDKKSVSTIPRWVLRSLLIAALLAALGCVGVGLRYAVPAAWSALRERVEQNAQATVPQSGPAQDALAAKQAALGLKSQAEQGELTGRVATIIAQGDQGVRDGDANFDAARYDAAKQWYDWAQSKYGEALR